MRPFDFPQRATEAAADALAGPGTDRRDFLVRVAAFGTAFAARPLHSLVRPPAHSPLRQSGVRERLQRLLLLAHGQERLPRRTAVGGWWFACVSTATSASGYRFYLDCVGDCPDDCTHCNCVDDPPTRRICCNTGYTNCGRGGHLRCRIVRCDTDPTCCGRSAAARGSRTEHVLPRVQLPRREQVLLMVWVVAALTVVVAVLTLLVLGLLRSQGELMRRTAALEAGASSPSTPVGASPGPTRSPSPRSPRSRAWTPGSIRTGWPSARFRRPTCSWRSSAPPASAVSTSGGTSSTAVTTRPVVAGDDVASVMIVLKGREAENLGKAAALATETPVPVVFSGPPGPSWPCRVAVLRPDRHGRPAGRRRRVGAGLGAAPVAGERRHARDRLRPQAPSNGRDGYRSIIEREDEDLRRAGIHPGHPSLTAPPWGSVTHECDLVGLRLSDVARRLVRADLPDTDGVMDTGPLVHFANSP